MARIAFIEVTSTVDYGGIQTAVWNLAETLSGLGHGVSVFGGNGTEPPPVRDKRVRVETFPFTPRERILNLGSRFRRIVERATFARYARKAVIAGEFEWAILNKPFDFFWPWIMPTGSKTRFAFVSGGTDFFGSDRWLARRVDAMFACSYFNAWQIRAHYRRSVAVIYNGVDTKKFAPANATAIRDRLGVSERTVLFAFAGRLVGWKGIGIAIRALVDPALRDTSTKLLVIGAGPERPRLKELARTLGVSDRVLFQDPVSHDDLPGYYAAADVGVFPSIGDEAFGITIAEAMSCAKPVIASYVGGIPEVVGNEGSSGLLVAPADTGQLAKAMRTLALDPERRALMGAAARERITDEFSWTAAAKRLLRGLGL